MTLRKVVLAIVALLALGSAAVAQSVKNPVLNLVGQAPGTINSTTRQNNYGSAVQCVFTQTSHTGTPSTTLSILGLDSGGSGQFYTITTSAAITADNTPTPLAAGKGVGVAPTILVPPGWRASVTIGGSGTVTATIGCTLG
jgi:hypothetical protein